MLRMFIHSDLVHVTLLLISLSILGTKVQSQADFPYLDFLRRCFDPCTDQQRATPPANGTFYIRLQSRTSCNQTEMAASANESRNISDFCRVSSSEDTRPECMCGNDLLDHEEVLVTVLNRTTCPGYRKIQENNSSLGICEEVFHSLGYCVTLVTYASVNDSIDNSTEQIGGYDISSLSQTVERIENQLLSYFNVIDRTIVGSYFKNKEHRCACLDSYKKWLCTTQLKSLYIHTEDLPDTTNSTGYCVNQTVTVPNPRMTSSTSTNTTLFRYRPCLSVCHRVVQTCPYYLPSSFQSVEIETVYGGYPAFDCPRADILKEMYTGPYYSGAYVYPHCGQCIGDNSAVSVHTTHTRTAILTGMICVLLLIQSWFVCM